MIRLDRKRKVFNNSFQETAAIGDARTLCNPSTESGCGRQSRRIDLRHGAILQDRGIISTISATCIWR